MVHRFYHFYKDNQIVSISCLQTRTSKNNSIYHHHNLSYQNCQSNQLIVILKGRVSVRTKWRRRTQEHKWKQTRNNIHTCLSLLFHSPYPLLPSLLTLKVIAFRLNFTKERIIIRIFLHLSNQEISLFRHGLNLSAQYYHDLMWPVSY